MTPKTIGPFTRTRKVDSAWVVLERAGPLSAQPASHAEARPREDCLCSVRLGQATSYLSRESRYVSAECHLIGRGSEAWKSLIALLRTSPS